MKNLIWLSLVIFFVATSCAQSSDQRTTTAPSAAAKAVKGEPNKPIRSDFPPVLEKGNYNELNEFETYIIDKKGTERAFTGQYVDNKYEGTYICRRCNLPLFSSNDKFKSGSGWPSFDDVVGPNAVAVKTDADGYRKEIVCHHCDGHLGHLFEGEGMTKKSKRYCVDSASLDFVKKTKKP
jgi:methionine-R-sulfoxide reductase